MKAIYKRELGAYFHSMIGSVCVAFMLAAVGLYFMVYNLYEGDPGFADALVSAIYLFIVVIPLLTMRSLAEDRKNKTDQLLLTAPVSVTGVVVGKFFAMVTVFAVPCVLYTRCPLIMKLASGSEGVVYFRSDYATLLAFLLLGALYISIGLFISSLTESQIIAAVATVGVLVLLYLWDGILNFLPTTASGNLVGMVIVVLLIALLLYSLTASAVVGGAVALVGILALVVCYLLNSGMFANLLSKVLGAFSLTAVLTNFATDYIFDLGGLVLYLSLTFLMLFLTVQMIQRRRWN